MCDRGACIVTCTYLFEEYILERERHDDCRLVRWDDFFGRRFDFSARESEGAEASELKRESTSTGQVFCRS